MVTAMSIVRLAVSLYATSWQSPTENLALHLCIIYKSFPPIQVFRKITISNTLFSLILVASPFLTFVFK